MLNYSTSSQVVSPAAPAAVGPLSVAFGHHVTPSAAPLAGPWCSSVEAASCRVAFCISLHSQARHTPRLFSPALNHQYIPLQTCLQC